MLKRALVLVLLSACGDAGVQRNSGLDAMLRVDGQFVEGAFPLGNSAGPSIGALRVVSQTARVGQTNRALNGAASNTAVSVALQLDGDPGYWVKPMGGADPVLADSLSFDANLSFSRFLTAGEHDLVVAASNAAGQFGEASRLRFTIVDLNALPDAQLAIRLSWDVDADLDLHVVQPDGVELWARKISDYEAPVVGPIDQAAADAAGKLDFDSNSGCRIDGRRLEMVTFRSPPPSGQFTARVDTFSMCGQVAAHWQLQVFKGSELISTTEGISLPSDTRFPHERGSGVLATQFSFP